MLSHKPNKLYWLLTQSTLHCTSKQKKREKSCCWGKMVLPYIVATLGSRKKREPNWNADPEEGLVTVYLFAYLVARLFTSRCWYKLPKWFFSSCIFDYLNCWTYKYVTDENLQEQRTFQRGSLRTSPPVFCLRCLIVDYGFLGLEVLLLIDDSRWIGCNFVIVEKYIDLIWFDLKERALWRQWILVVEYSFLA